MQTTIVHIPMKRRPISRARFGGQPTKAELDAMRAEETERVARDTARCYMLNLAAAFENRLAAGYNLDGTRIDSKSVSVDDRDANAAAAADDDTERAAERAAEQAAEDSIGGFTD